MKTLDELYNELENYDSNDLKDKWNKIMGHSKKISGKFKKFFLFIDLPIFLILIFRMLYASDVEKMTLFIILSIVFFNTIFAFLITFVAASDFKAINSFIQEYKETVLKKIMSNFYDNLEYFPDKSMPRYIYNEPKYEKFDTYASNEYIEAHVNNNYSFQMAYVHTMEKKLYTDSNDDLKTEYITKFNGLFAKIVMDKFINNELQITQDGKLSADKKRLNMDSSEFEKYFDVKSSDSIVAMQLLTSDIMEELIEFENKTNIKFDIYIKNNCIYLRFHSINILININAIKKGSLDKSIIEKYYYILNLSYNLSNKLIDTINNTQL